jgi:CubicO group peptidase (beta-lactamase class C family)
LKLDISIARRALGGACFVLAVLSGGARSLWGADDASHAIVSNDAPPAFPPAPPAPALPAAPVPALMPASSASEASAPAPLEIPEIDAIVSKAVRAGRTPGAVVIVGRRDGVVFRSAYGRRAIIPQREEMTADTIFDLASLTKPLVVGSLIQCLVQEGRLDIHRPVVDYLPEFGVREKYLVTVEQLLLHTSGLPPSNSLNDFKHGPRRARELTLGGWLYKRSGREFIYSDIGYIALGEMIEAMTGERLDRTAERVIFGPLGMRDTHYCAELCSDPRVAPTELNYGWVKNPIRGEPSDTRAHRLGGVAGNAGLFSSADDLARFARMLLSGGELDGVRVLTRDSVADLMQPRAVPKAKRTLGFDVSSGFSSGRGHHLSERAIGHSGYTGTSFWVDPVLDLFVIFLSNRNHPFSTGKVTDIQALVTDAAVRALHPEKSAQAALPQLGAPERREPGSPVRDAGSLQVPSGSSLPSPSALSSGG